MKRWLNHKVVALWNKRNAMTLGLYPLSLGFRTIASIRRFAYQHYFIPNKLPVPVIVVGNISVGGTGKTPLVIWLANALKQQGFFPGIVTRGYKRDSCEFVFADTSSTYKDVGDEALVLAKNAGCPIVVGKKRRLAASLLIKKHPEINVIISDDGLQHYALSREVEIAVVDGLKKFGNGFCLPAGPLREPPKRLKSVDFVVVNGEGARSQWSMQTHLQDKIQGVSNGKEDTLSSLAGKKVHAVAAIGSPERFFNELKKWNIDIIPHVFPDHYCFNKDDLSFNDNHPILMTEKDAVKCHSIAPSHAWFVRQSITLSDEFLLKIIGRISHGQKAS